MNKTFLATAAILVLAPTAALAQERAGDAALGAVSGAIVLGPIGAVAGAVVGYTAGPSIAHSWGLHHHSRQARPRRYSSTDGRQPESPPPPPTSRAGEVAANGGGRVADMGASGKAPVQPAPMSAASAPVSASPPPPVQGFD